MFDTEKVCLDLDHKAYVWDLETQDTANTSRSMGSGNPTANTSRRMGSGNPTANTSRRMVSGNPRYS
ncbi:hypothetical protein RRG08_011132 [Elysia crispata]|uniref:Uncharacterized protein n=1 Tax=Elysia crispata TaxID=231223 RepID=A0AAE1A1A8_9GAST|nr:hypothetical protein RRG08_011132 [Elysia crispata]